MDDSVSNCAVNANLLLYNKITLAPALFIILLSTWMKKSDRKNKKCCRRCGILSPVDFLRLEENRFSYAMAYNSTIVSVISLFIGSVSGNENFGLIPIMAHAPTWLQAFESILNVTYEVIVNMPFFLALSMENMITGSVLGFLYTSFRLFVVTNIMAHCPRGPFSDDQIVSWWPLLMAAPLFGSYLFLIIRFAVIFGQEIRRKHKKRKSKTYTVSENDEKDGVVVAGEGAINYVKSLLNPVEECSEPWYIKARNLLYEPKPEFKFSVQIIATVIVASVMIYEFFIILAAGVVGNLRIIQKNLLENGKELIEDDVLSKDTIDILLIVLEIAIPTLWGTISFSLLFMYFQMYRLLISHRNHVIKMSRTDKKFLPQSLPSPDAMVGYCLRYCGYQIAYLVWGFITLVLCLVVTVALLTAIIVLIILREDVKEFTTKVALAALPTTAVTVLVWIFQAFLSSCVFKYRKQSQSAIAIDNRRLFLLASFFFFFFNIIVGLLTCLSRILVGIVLGIFFLGRIDRPVLMKGFHILDVGYMAYLGFLHVQVAHKHPILVVFCHIMLDNNKPTPSLRTRGNKEMLSGQYEMVEANVVIQDVSLPRERPRVSQAAYNRWFVALTLMRNPSLVPNRRKFFRSVILKSSSYGDMNEGQTQEEEKSEQCNLSV